MHITAPADTLLANSALADNRAGVAGGAIALAGAPGAPNTLRLLNGTFRGNSAPAGADIAVATPAATVLVGGRGGTPAQGIAGEGVGGAAWRPQLVSEAEVARGPAVPGTPALLSEEEAFIAEAATVRAAGLWCVVATGVAAAGRGGDGCARVCRCLRRRGPRTPLRWAAAAATTTTACRSGRRW